MSQENHLEQLERKLQDLMDRTQVLEQRERKLQHLIDRAQILDCIARHARGCDRFDSELLTSAYHDDGVDEHGFAINPGPKYAEWANAQHSRGSQQNMHNITTHSCQIEGNVAHAESYVIGLFLNADGKTARLLAGRYADRLERRDGEWRIVLRRSTVDVALAGDASFLSLPYFVEMGFVKGMRDKRDVSYQRPLTLEETPADRW
jgi:hypothetical protein